MSTIAAFWISCWNESSCFKIGFTYERNIYWKSSDLSAATVDGAGNVTTHGVGTAMIRAYSTTNDRVWGTCMLTVEEEAPVSVTVRQYPAKREYTTADVFDPTDGLLPLRYPNGQVRSIRISPDFCSGYDMTQTGEQTVTIRYAGSTFTYSVIVREADEAPQNTQMQNEAAQTVSAYAEHILIIWTSSDESIATVDAYGRVTGIAPGVVEITAQVDGSEAVTSCTVTVVPRTAERNPGDADGDGEVTLKDVTQIARYLVGGWDAVIDLMNADVNGDGKVDLKDVVLMRRYLAGGWNVTLR